MTTEEPYLNTAPCFFFGTAENGTLTFVNDTLSSALGFMQEELTGKKVDLIFTVSTRIFYQTHLFPLLKIQGHAEEIFITLKTKHNKEIPMLLNAERKMYNDEPYTIFAAIGVYNRKKFEDEIISAKKTAETALSENVALNEVKQQLQLHIKQLDQQMYMVNKQNDELRQFNHAITHSLQEPLRKLSVFADILQLANEKHDLQKTAVKLLGVIGQMRDVVAGLQQYVWLSAGSYSSVDLNTTVTTCLEQLQKEYADINIVIERDELPTINADSKQMHLLFYELLNNAVKFRKPGNVVNIKINATILMLNKFKNVTGKYEYIEFVKIELTDKGIGFKSEYGEQIFQLFRKLHHQSGKGVGLSLCRKIAENHHGSITIDGSENEWAAIELYLPIDASGIWV